MSRRRTMSLALGLATALATSLATSVAAQSLGWTYTMKIDTDSGQGAAYRRSTAMQYQMLDHKFRMEFVQATGDMGAIEGTYTIFNDADSTVTMVMPSAHMVTVSSFAAVQGAVATTGLKHVTRYTKTDVVDVGAGERMLGHATRQYHVTVAGTIDWTMGDQSCTQPIDEDMDYWMAPDVDMGGALTSLKGMSSMANAFDDSGAVLSKMPKGAMMRMTMKQAIVDAQGAPRTLTTTMSIVELSHGPVAEASFAIPAGFKTMDVRKMMTKMPAGLMDSVMQASSGHMLDVVCGGARKS